MIMLEFKYVLFVLRIQMRNIDISTFPLLFYLLHIRYLGLVKKPLEAFVPRN